ncbi:polysaccharide biosynthesis tyrosine autokinase [bacterium]|nr:polysaccharide biosynthesis tyrosine autokinase [bacterium]
MSNIDHRNADETPSRNEGRGTGLRSEFDEGGGFDVREYAGILWRRKWIILFSVLIFMFIGVFQLKKSTPMYSASSMIKYEPTSTQIVEFGEIGRSVSYVDEIKTQVEMIRSPRVTKMVIDALGLMDNVKHTPRELSPVEKVIAWTQEQMRNIRKMVIPHRPVPVDPKELELQGAIANLQSRVGVRQHLETKLIRISVTHPDPIRAARIANEYSVQYIRSLNEDKSESYRYAITFLQNQIDDTKDRLENAEKALYEYKGDSDLRVMEQNLSIAVETMRTLSASIEDTKNEISMYEAEAKAAEESEVRSYLLTEDPTYVALSEKRNELEIERIAMAAENEPDYPPLRRLERQITALADQITSATGRVRTEAAGRAKLARMRLDALQDRLGEAEELVQRLRGEMVQYNVLQREVDSTKELYDSLLSRFKEINVSADIEGSNVTIFSEAGVPRFPSSPDFTTTMVLFTFFGGFLGVALALGLHKLDRSIHTPQQVETELGLASLGMVPYLGGTFKIPLVRRRQRRRIQLIDDSGSMSGQAEAFRFLRTSLQYSTAGHSPQVIVVTSCFPREGKSTVASNLGIVFASRGEKTLLIDGDLKLPITHRCFQINKRPGLSDILTGQCEWREALHTDVNGGLDVIPAGHDSPSPVELLESDAMMKLITDLRKEYKTIIIDSAPLHGMADSFVLGKKVDGVCLVANIGRTRRDILESVTDSLTSMNVRILGVVYNNQVKRSQKSTAYYYGYEYGKRYNVRHRRGYREEEETESNDNN